MAKRSLAPTLAKFAIRHCLLLVPLVREIQDWPEWVEAEDDDLDDNDNAEETGFASQPAC